MIETIFYEKEYKSVINKSYHPDESYNTLGGLLRGMTFEEDEKDNLRSYLIKQSLEIRYEELRVMHAGIIREVSKPNEFLWSEKSLFHIKLYRKEGQKNYYKRVIEIKSMPPSEIPKTLEKKLKIEGFKEIKKKS